MAMTDEADIERLLFRYARAADRWRSHSLCEENMRFANSLVRASIDGVQSLDLID